MTVFPVCLSASSRQFGPATMIFAWVLFFQFLAAGVVLCIPVFDKVSKRDSSSNNSMRKF